jgi:hypothetical protein
VVSVDAIISASSMSRKYSWAPNATASETSNGESSIRPSVDRVPAMNEPMAAVASAGPARPRRAISYPSMAVTTLDTSPGVRISVAVIEPPYMVP